MGELMRTKTPEVDSRDLTIKLGFLPLAGSACCLGFSRQAWWMITLCTDRVAASAPPTAFPLFAGNNLICRKFCADPNQEVLREGGARERRTSRCHHGDSSLPLVAAGGGHSTVAGAYQMYVHRADAGPQEPGFASGSLAGNCGCQKCWATRCLLIMGESGSVRAHTVGSSAAPMGKTAFTAFRRRKVLPSLVAAQRCSG